MKIGEFSIDVVSGGTLRLDGGNMFGPVPRVLWEKKIAPDEQHRIPMDTNCLLVRGPDICLLIDTGYGGKADEKRRKFQGLEEREPLLRSLGQHGVLPSNVTHVVLTHLHFDHAGGCTRRAGEIVFPNAQHFVQRSEWDDATARLPELAGSYFEEDFVPLEKSGRLVLLEGDETIVPGVRVRRVGGHTRGMQVVDIADGDGGLLAVALADLCPSIHHVKTFWTLSYDQFPLEVRRTKPIVLSAAADARALCFFSHDIQTRWAYLKRDSKQEFVVEPRSADS